MGNHPSPVPDKPVAFGYKIAWLALRGIDTEAVASALGLRDQRRSTWAEVIRAAYDTLVFVTPPLSGWTLAVGFRLCPPDPVPATAGPLVEKLSAQFGEAQFFCTHRVVELHVWARAVSGRLTRGYCWIGEKGLTLWDAGPQTNEERSLGFQFFDERCPEANDNDYWARTDLTFADEEDVMNLARLWSIAPIDIEEKFREEGLGILGSRI